MIISLKENNVFKDLGCFKPDHLIIKSELCRLIVKTIEEKRIRQVDVAEMMGITQSKVSHMVNGKLGMFTVIKLMQYYSKLVGTVSLMITADGCFEIITGGR